MDDINKQSTGFSTPLILSKREGWRIRAKLAVRSGPKIGLFKPGTHEVEDLRGCKDHHPSIEKALDLVRAAEFVPYNEEAGTGDLRYIQMTVERGSGLVQLVLVANGEGKCTELAKRLGEESLFHSVWINVQTGSTNTILGRKWKLVVGEEMIEQKLLGKKVYFHPACFIQANFDLFEKVVMDLRAMLLEGKNVLEFYAGVGAIALAIEKKSASVDCIEVNPYAEKCFLKSDPGKKLQFFTGEADDFLDLLKGKEVLIVDPPRKGLDPKLLEAVLASELEQILYLSCSEKTLKRDLEALREGGWRVETVRQYEFFPGTEHIETLVSCKRG